MIKVNSHSPEELYLKTFIKLYKSEHFFYTDELLKEVTAVLSVSPYNEREHPFLSFNGRDFKSTFDYSTIVEGGNSFAKEEFEHYQDELVHTKRIEKIIQYLKLNKTSKRCIINIWKEKYLNIRLQAPCLVYLDFLQRDEGIVLNWHQRASDAFKLLILDIQVARTLQVYIAKTIGKNPAHCNLFIDSLHFYRKDAKAIEIFYNKINSQRKI